MATSAKKMSATTVLVGTRKGLFILRADGTVDVFAMGEFKYVAAMHPARFVVSHDGEMYVRIALP